MRSRLYVPLQEVHPTLIEITNRINKQKKGLLGPFFNMHYLLKKLNHHKQGIPVHPGWHRRIVPKH